MIVSENMVDNDDNYSDDVDIADETAGLVLSSDLPVSDEIITSPIESKIASAANNFEPARATRHSSHQRDKAEPDNDQIETL